MCLDSELAWLLGSDVCLLVSTSSLGHLSLSTYSTITWSQESIFFHTGEIRFFQIIRILRI